MTNKKQSWQELSDLKTPLNDSKAPMQSPLSLDDLETPPRPKAQIVQIGVTDDYKETNNEPNIPFKKLPLAVIPGLLIAANIRLAQFFQIPSLQYLFVTVLLSFLINYYIIRTYDLFPYLPVDSHDNQLKISCLLTFIVFLCSIQWGWNGSGGIIVAIAWEMWKRNPMGPLIYGYIVAIIGAVLLQGNYSYSKLIEFIPGVLLGVINSNLFTLKTSSPYTIYHQFSLLCSIFLPIFFPLQQMIKPTLLQWGILAAASFLVQLTAHSTIKMMQKERVSISMTTLSSIVMLLTTVYVSTVAYLEGALILVGLLFILYREYMIPKQEL